MQPMPGQRARAMFEDDEATVVQRAPERTPNAPTVLPEPAPRERLEAALRQRDQRIADLEATLSRLDRELGALRASPVTPLPGAGPYGAFSHTPLPSEPPSFSTTTRPPPEDDRGRTVMFVTFAICGVVLTACAVTIAWAFRVLDGKSPDSTALGHAVSSADRSRSVDPMPRPSASSGAEAQTAPPPNAAASAAPDPASLLSYQGYLTVRSSVAGDVYVNGVRAGVTNTPIVVRCGVRNVRVATPPLAWVGPGLVTRVACRGAAEITLAPSR